MTGTPARAPLRSNEALLRELERAYAAEGACYRVERYVPSADDRAAYTMRATSLLGAARWEQRNLGVKLIGLLQATGHYGAIVQILQDRTPAGWLARCFGGDFRQVGFIRRNAIAALARLGVVTDEVEAVLVASLADPYYEARSEAARAIAQMGDDLTTRRVDLVAALERCTADRSIEVAAAAAEALGWVGDQHRALPALLALADARFWKVRLAALKGLLALVARNQCDDVDEVERRARRFVLTSTDFQPHFHIKRAYGDLLTAIARRKETP